MHYPHYPNRVGQLSTGIAAGDFGDSLYPMNRTDPKQPKTPIYR